MKFVDEQIKMDKFVLEQCRKSIPRDAELLTRHVLDLVLEWKLKKQELKEGGQ